MKRSTVCAISLVILVAGCGGPRIDTSSDEKLEESISKVRASLAKEDQTKFDDALQTIAFSQISLEDLLKEGGASELNLTENKMKDALEGKSANEVIVTADSIKTVLEAKQREQALQEIGELERKKAEAEAAQDELAAFEIVRSRFYKEKDYFGGLDPIVELSVRNGTEHAVSRAYFEGTLASPGRSVPWVKDGFNYSIAGGLEPGESASWRLAPNSFSDWGTVDVPQDAVLTIETTRLDDAEGNALFDGNSFDEYDEERLKELKKKFGL